MFGNDTEGPAEGSIDPLIIPAANQAAALDQDWTLVISPVTLLL